MSGPYGQESQDGIHNRHQGSDKNAEPLVRGEKLHQRVRVRCHERATYALARDQCVEVHGFEREDDRVDAQGYECKNSVRRLDKPGLLVFINENGGDKLVHGSGGISQPRAE